MDPKRISEADAYKALLVIVTGAVAIGLIFNLRPLLGGAVALGLIGALSPKLTVIIARAWFRFALALGWINARILLSVLFFLLITPLALLYRLRGADPMKHNRKGQDSLFVTRDHTYTSKDLDKPW